MEENLYTMTGTRKSQVKKRKASVNSSSSQKTVGGVPKSTNKLGMISSLSERKLSQASQSARSIDGGASSKLENQILQHYLSQQRLITETEQFGASQPLKNIFGDNLTKQDMDIFHPLNTERPSAKHSPVKDERPLLANRLKSSRDNMSELKITKGQLDSSFKRIADPTQMVAESVEVMSAGCGSAKFLCTIDNRE